ncbi:MAG TPA: Verru_Chthon cassette protein D [Roseimicrobium sp.]|nr:Verru_Chthon cassette protein D [Roseimicrobium sp.]
MKGFSHRPAGASLRKARPLAFTLIEMMVVIAIIAIIAAFVTPVAGSLLKASQLTQAGQLVVGQLSLARQTALSRNLPIEVRLYRFGDPEIPGENKGKYRAFQSFEVQPNGAVLPLGQLSRLPQTVIIDSSGALSSILNQTQRPASTPSASAPKVPGVEYAYEYVAFRFRPDGSTDLREPAEPAKQWFLTLHGINDGDARPTPPPNFETIQINPFNGNIRTFRP